MDTELLMNTDLLTLIEERMDTFSKSQKKIAQFILTSYEQAAYMTALKMGQAVKVSESTVVRFAIELGFTGYPELQKNLRTLIRNRLTASQRLAISNSRISRDVALKSTLNADIDRIKHTLDEINTEMFDLAIREISNARRIYILGAMSSSILARFLDYNLQLIFDNVHFIQAISTSGIYQQMIRISKEDTFIAISFPRYSKSTVNATAYAKSCGANVVAITDTYGSPLVEYADQLLLAKSDMASFADSLVAPLSVLNAMIVALGSANESTLSSTFAKLELLWEENDVYKKDV